jgi:hypothetical protein
VSAHQRNIIDIRVAAAQAPFFAGAAGKGASFSGTQCRIPV